MTRLIPVAMIAILACGLGSGIAPAQTLDQGTGDQASRSLDRPEVAPPAKPPPRTTQVQTPTTRPCPAGMVPVVSRGRQTKCRRRSP